MREICKQLQTLSESVQDLVQILNDSTQASSDQSPKERIEEQNCIKDKFEFFKSHIRKKDLSEYPG